MTAFNFHSTAEEVTYKQDLTGKTYLVTGSNSGLGKETIRILALRGAKIVACARNTDKATAALKELGIKGIPVACDLADLHSVGSAIDTIQDLGLELQGIIANAGIMALPRLKQQNGIELQFYTNHIGHFHLVTNLIDQLSNNGRVVILSSRAHGYARKSGLELDNLSGENNYNDWRMYGRSKLANILFARSLNHRFSETDRTANSVHPGVIKTNLGRYVPDRDAMYAQIQKTIPLKSIPQGAATQCFVAVHPSLEGIGGQYFNNCQIDTPIPQGEDDILAEELWQITEQIVDRDIG